jgi:hypothetical protein
LVAKFWFSFGVGLIGRRRSAGWLRRMTKHAGAPWAIYGARVWGRTVTAVGGRAGLAPCKVLCFKSELIVKVKAYKK